MSVYQDEQTKLFTPSSTDLLHMIKAAEAKADAARERALRERAEVIFARNLRRRVEKLQNDARRRRHASDQLI